MNSNFHELDLSVTRWLGQLRDGDEAAAGALWEFLSERLLRLARRQMQQNAEASYDEEDLALSAFTALWDQFRQGSYKTIEDRGELWQLIAVILLNKARNRRRDQNRICRGGQMTRCELSSAILAEFGTSDSNPATTAMMQDECQRMLTTLGKRDVQLVALLRVEGYTNEQIAQQLGCTRRSVQRRINLIRELWSEELG